MSACSHCVEGLAQLAVDREASRGAHVAAFLADAHGSCECHTYLHGLSHRLSLDSTTSSVAGDDVFDDRSPAVSAARQHWRSYKSPTAGSGAPFTAEEGAFSGEGSSASALASLTQIARWCWPLASREDGSEQLQGRSIGLPARSASITLPAASDEAEGSEHSGATAAWRGSSSEDRVISRLESVVDPVQYHYLSSRQARWSEGGRRRDGMPRIASGEALKDLPALSPPRLRKSEGAEDENEKQRAALSLQSFPLKDGPTSPTCAAGTDGEGWTRFTEGMASLIRLSWSTGAEQATAVEDGVAESGPNGDRYQAMMEGEMELKPLKSSEQQHSARSHPPPVAALACSPPHSPLANSPGALAGAIGPAAEGDDETSVQAGAAEDATEEEEEEGAGGAPLEGEERAPPSLPQTTPQLVILPTFSVWQPPSAPPSVEEEEDEEGEEEREEEREDGSGAAAPSSVGLRASFHPQTEPCGRTASTRSRSDGDAEDEKDMLGQGRVTAVARSAGRDPAAGTPAHQPEPEAQKGAGGGSEAVGPALSAAAWSWPWLGGAAAAAETGAPAAGERAWSSMSAAAAFALAPDSGDGEEPRRGWGRSFSLEQPAAGAAAAAAEARQLQRGASAGADASPSQQQAQSAPGSPKREPSWRIASSFPNIRMLWPSAPPAAAAGAAAPRPPPPAAASAALAALEGEREGAAAALGLDSDAAAAEGVQQVVTEEHLLHLGSLLGEAQAASVLAAVGAAPEAGHERSLLGVPDMPAAAFSALEWERIVQEVKPGFHYQAWRKPLRGGLYVYKTRMTVDGASAAELRAFHHHPSTRALVDHTMETYQLLPCPGRGEEETGFFFMTARFPRPMASRAYVSARRTWLRPADGGCYTVNLGARHPDAPRASGSIMVHDYLSAYVIRSGPAPEQGGDSAVLETLYFDNSGVRPGVVNFTIRMGLWKVVQPYEAAFRRHQAAATPPRPLPPPPQPVPAAAALQALLRAVPSHSGDARPEAAAAGKGVPGGIPLVARAGPVAAGPQRHRGGWRRLKPMVLLGIALKLASSRRPGCSRRHE